MNTPRPSATAVSARWVDELEAVREVLERFRLSDRSAAADDDRLAWIDAVRDIGRRVGALAAVLVAEADEAGSAMRARHTRLEDWMARDGQETPREASGAVWAARTLERRPGVRDAAAAGRISLGQARAIGEALDALPTGLEPSQRRLAEDLLLAEAAHLPAEKLRRMTEKVLARVSPEHVDSEEAAAAKLEARDLRARSRRRLWFGPENDGSIEFSGSLPVIDGRRLQGMVQAVADRYYRAAKDARDRKQLQETPQQRAADALVAILDVAERSGSSGSSGACGGSRDAGTREGDDRGAREGDAGGARGGPLPRGATELQVIIPYDQLLNRATAAGVLADGTPVSASQLRQLACDASLVPAVLGTESQLLDVGRGNRLATPAIRQAVGLRDGGCAFPGCTAPLRHCELHHVVPWQVGGPTGQGNLVALCKVHHALCEPRPPAESGGAGSGSGRAEAEQVDQWEVRIDRRGLPEFLPPAALDPLRTPRRRVGHAAALFDHAPPRESG